MRKLIVGVVVGMFAGVLVSMDVGCAAAFCSSGIVCDGSCLPANSQCCDNSAGTACSNGLVCGPDNTCLTSGENQAVGSAEGCVEQGLEPCVGPGGTIGCIPIGANCCIGTGRYCQGNQTCGGACGDECCNL